MSEPEPGLCARCTWSRRIEARGGAIYRLCEKSRDDPRFDKYPRLPVVRCGGFQQAPRG